jgi:uncharacterized membrane protein (DUF485 family)
MTKRSMSHPSPSSLHNARFGLILFAVYFVFYAGFIGLNAFAPGVMAAEWWGGVNVAIWYGMALIAAAFGLAVVYLYHARDDHHEETSL